MSSTGTGTGGRGDKGSSWAHGWNWDIWRVDPLHWCKEGDDELDRQVRVGLVLNWKGVELEGQVGHCTGGLKGRISGNRVIGEKVIYLYKYNCTLVQLYPGWEGSDEVYGLFIL